MYVVPPCNKITYHLLIMKPLYRYFLTFMLLATPTLVWFFYWYSPLQDAIMRDELFVENAHKQQQLRLTMSRDVKTLQATIDQLESATKQQKNNQQLNGMPWLLDTAQRTKVALIKSSVLDRIEKETHAMVGYALTASGIHHDILNFLTQLQKTQSLVALLELTINQGSECELVCTVNVLELKKSTKIS